MNRWMEDGGSMTSGLQEAHLKDDQRLILSFVIPGTLA